MSSPPSPPPSLRLPLTRHDRQQCGPRSEQILVFTYHNGHAGTYFKQQLPLFALLIEYLQLMIAFERAQPAKFGETEVLVHCHCRLARCGMQEGHARTIHAQTDNHREIRLCRAGRTNLPRIRTMDAKIRCNRMRDCMDSNYRKHELRRNYLQEKL